MSTFKERLLQEPIRAIYRSDKAFIESKDCHRMMFDEETNAIWYILNPNKEVIPTIIGWVMVPLASIAGIAFKEEKYEETLHVVQG